MIHLMKIEAVTTNATTRTVVHLGGSDMKAMMEISVNTIRKEAILMELAQITDLSKNGTVMVTTLGESANNLGIFS